MPGCMEMDPFGPPVLLPIFTDNPSSQGCSKAMMGAATLNALLLSCKPQHRGGSSRLHCDANVDELPPDFARSYFHEVAQHSQGLWYVSSV